MILDKVDSNLDNGKMTLSTEVFFCMLYLLFFIMIAIRAVIVEHITTWQPPRLPQADSAVI